MKGAGFISSLLLAGGVLLGVTNGCTVAPAEEAEVGELVQDVSHGVTYEIKAPNLANKCADVSANSSAPGANVQLWTCNGTTAQKWVATDRGGGWFSLQHAGTNQCLNRDTSANNSNGGGNVHQWDCQWAGSPEYQWRFESSNGYQRIVNRYDGRCLDVSAASSADGANIQTWSCNGTSAQVFNPVASGSAPPPPPSPPPSGNGIGAIVSSSTFNSMFPNRIAFYTHSALVAAGNAWSQFVGSGYSTTIRKREAAAFLANIFHESDQLRAVREYNANNYCNYCDWSRPYGCPAGQCNYYGRGPMQLSWNFNYKTTGDALGIDLLNNPDRVATDATVAWKTAVHYWMTNSGPNTMTAHAGITCTAAHCGFGQTIRSINGSLECDGRNPGAVQSRVNKYIQFCQMLGVDPGPNLYC